MEKLINCNNSIKKCKLLLYYTIIKPKVNISSIHLFYFFDLDDYGLQLKKKNKIQYF